MADIPDMNALVALGVATYDSLPATHSVADDIRAILTAVLPLVTGPAVEALGVIFNGADTRLTCDCDLCKASRRARNTLSQLKALGTGEG